MAEQALVAFDDVVQMVALEVPDARCEIQPLPFGGGEYLHVTGLPSGKEAALRMADGGFTADDVAFLCYRLREVVNA